MLEFCPTCGQKLSNAYDSKQYIEYPAAKLQEFAADLLTLDQLNEFALIYYNRVRVCTNKGNNDFLVKENGDNELLNPPCPMWCGEDMSNPKVIIETLKIKDE